MIPKQFRDWFEDANDIIANVNAYDEFIDEDFVWASPETK